MRTGIQSRLLSRYALFGCALLLVGPPVVRAYVCRGDEQLEVRPGTDARGVALDATIRARFPGDAAVLAELWRRFDEGERLIKLVHEVDDTTGELVEGQLQRGGDRMLYFVPDAPLEPNETYRVTVTSPDPVRVDPWMEKPFTTGFREDMEAPVLFVDSDGLTLHVEDADVSCGPKGTVRVRIGFDSATDDGDPGSVEHFAYLTRAAGLEAPRLVHRWFAATDTASLDFLLSPEEAGEPVCVRVRAVDGVDKMAEEEPEICFDPVQGSFFRPLCHVSAAGAPSRGRDSRFATSFLLLSGLAWRLRRRTGVGPRVHRGAS